MKKAYQIIFNDTSAAELSALPKALQLEVLSQLETVPAEAIAAGSEGAAGTDAGKFGRMDREGRSLLRFRAGDHRIYFEQTGKGIVVHRILHKNTLKDFFFRSSLPVADAAEDQALQKNVDFWKMIDGSNSGPNNSNSGGGPVAPGGEGG